MAKRFELAFLEEECHAAISSLFGVEGFGMVRVEAVHTDAFLLWLPFEPIPVQQRLM